MTQELERQQRRGIRFPTYHLSEALRLARTVQDQGAGRLSANATAGALELSFTSSSFGSRISAAKHFGVLEEKDGILTTTPLARKILRPVSQEQETEGLSEAFLDFEVFKDLFERFQNGPLPQRSNLENILVTEYGISDVSKGLAYDVFVESGKFAGKITDTGKALLVGFQDEGKIKGTTETVEASSSVVLDSNLVSFLMNIGSLRTALEISSASAKDIPEKIESISRSLLETTLATARELELPATRISLKVVSDRLRTSGLQDAYRFVQYLEEGLSFDLASKGGGKIE